MTRGWTKEARSRERHPTATINLRLRMGEELRKKIEASARLNRRSMNSEIIYLLERSFAEVAYREARATGVSEEEAIHRALDVMR